MGLKPEVRRGGGLPFGQVVSQWVCDPRYTTNLRTLYSILVTYADIGGRDTGKGRPYRSELAAQLGCSKSTLDRTIVEGECAGLFWVESRTDPANPSLNEANVYHLNDAQFWRGEWTDPLEPGMSAKQAAEAMLEARRKTKRESGIERKGGRKKKSAARRPQGGGFTGDATLGEGGGITGEARGGITGEARGGFTRDAQYLEPLLEPLHQEPQGSRPSVPVGGVRAHEDNGRTDGQGVAAEVEDQVQPEPRAGLAAADAAPPASPRMVRTPGVQLLLDIGQQHPDFAIWGKPLVDQAQMVTGMLDAGWTRAQVRQIVTGQPLPEKIRKSVAAIVSKRLAEAARVGPPGGYRPFVPPQTPTSPTPQPQPQPEDQAMPQTARSTSEPCPGWDGTPCGTDSRPTDEDGLCGTCRYRVTRREEAAKKPGSRQLATRGGSH
ncbi:hypothetical protein SAMN06297387_12839 [Streptomyces zhaozhouensis]|uniref:Helix-turn-helix domain-containing protein n=1 Tax=Streptomyces zhaozhouensis TaxID=1300267 RepID=A0A286E817_9ACTN|nr:hypothetical protein [Streptomyces zhaozhouensis]SOD67031.1 hypothetical protein SAMN06297387_12839 [Streptomyces zhaozhouensis]